MDTISGVYDRTDSEMEKGYDRHLFRAGHILQSAELNEIQGAAAYRHKQLGDAIFKDGDIVRDARLVVDSVTGSVIAESGAIYIGGAVRGVPPAEFSIPITGTVVVGIYLDRTIVTEAEDPTLADPAVETQAYGEPGAARLQIQPRWGVQEDEDDDSFYPVYYVDEGNLRAKEAPPVMDAVSQAIARYDVDSTGSNYVVEGLRVTRLEDEDSTQVYNVDQGRARVNGFGVNLTNSRRVIHDTQPVIKTITSEPMASSTASRQWVTLARPPAREISQVTITREKTADIVHSSVSGGADPLPDGSVVQIISVTQGGDTFAPGDDYVLTGQTVDWSPSGAEPSPGSTYRCTYRYIAVEIPDEPTSRGYYVTGAVPGTLVMTTYNTMLPRIDRLCIDDEGRFVWVEGVSTDYTPVRPAAPSNLIPIAMIEQNWDETSQVYSDGVRTVSMRTIENFGRELNTIRDMIAQQLLISDVNTREAGVKRGLFVDPFLDDSHRDEGITQTAACVNGVLMLPIDGEPKEPHLDVAAPQTCEYQIEVVASQNERTGSMKVNPYMAFNVPMATVSLNPAVDRWTEVSTTWASPITERFVVDNRIMDAYHIRKLGTGFAKYPSQSTTNTEDVLAGSTSRLIQYLRTIEVKFVIEGFGPGEVLTSVTFDGIPVTASAI